MHSRRGTLRIIYILSAYVVLQLIWWGYHIIQLTKEIEPSADVQRRIWMILGEGSVFVMILGIGIYKLRQLHKREEASKEKERNFLLAVTHELKTPIASSKLALETIQSRQLNDELRAKMIDNALASNLRLEDLVDKILLSTNLSSRHESDAKTSFDLNQELDRITRLNFSTLDAIIDLELYLAESCTLRMNLLEFETIINNLIQNAIKYQGEGDKIVVRTITGSSTMDILIEDNGPGISDTEKPRVFEKFYRMGDEMTRSTKGTGLGLYLVKELVLRNKGQISILDNTPKGAIFKLTFPTI